MRLIKILIETEEQGMIINNLLADAEDNGDIDFGFSLRITEPLETTDDFYNERSKQDG
jgi:hypothetical protein